MVEKFESRFAARSFEDTPEIAGQRPFNDDSLFSIGVIHLDANAMQEGAIEGIFLFEKTVGRGVTIFFVAKHRVPYGSEVPPNLMRAPFFRNHAKHAVAAGDREAPKARTGRQWFSILFKISGDGAFRRRDSTNARQVDAPRRRRA